MQEHVPKSYLKLLTFNGGNKLQKRKIGEISAIRHFTLDSMGDLTSPILAFIALFSCYSKAFWLNSII